VAAGVGIQQELIVRAALTLLDEVGLEGLTMRRLATALKIQAPSLYWHFPNKQALLDGMADAIFGAVSLPRNLKGKTRNDKTRNDKTWNDKTWDERLKAVFRSIRRAFLAHRDGARVFAGTYVPTDNVLRVVEAMMALMQEAGASPKLSSDAAFSLVYFVLGFTMEEQGLDPRTGGPLDLANRQATFANLAAMKYPSIHAALHRMFDDDLDDRFEAGLDLLITGLKARIDSRS
jgi:TetR/AcrR family transcriptional regulator, tetracycline repressor protein